MKKANLLFFFMLSGVLRAGGALAAGGDNAEPGEMETSPPQPTQQQKLGALQVESNPAGAQVFVTSDESQPAEELGPTPLEEDASPGVYWVSVAMEGYEEVTVKVNVNPGEKTIVRIDLALKNSSFRAKRTAGHSLLWPGIAAVAAGVVLIEIEPQGKIGAAGFVTAGVGVALTIAGGILLGISHSDKLVYEQPQLAVAPLDDLSGGGILFSKSF